MITIIVGTNRPNSNSSKVAQCYSKYLKERKVSHDVLSIADLPDDFSFADMFEGHRDEMKGVVERYIKSADKFVFIVPEYNGGFPGVLKAFIDVVAPSDFHGKKAGIVGLSSGHAGALLAMDQLTSILNYLKMSVHFSKPKLSNIDGSIDKSGEIVDSRALKLIQEHVIFMCDF